MFALRRLLRALPLRRGDPGGGGGRLGARGGGGGDGQVHSSVPFRGRKKGGGGGGAGLQHVRLVVAAAAAALGVSLTRPPAHTYIQSLTHSLTRTHIHLHSGSGSRQAGGQTGHLRHGPSPPPLLSITLLASGMAAAAESTPRGAPWDGSDLPAASCFSAACTSPPATRPLPLPSSLPRYFSPPTSARAGERSFAGGSGSGDSSGSGGGAGGGGSSWSSRNST
ncbi:uncharacterized protein LOC141562014 [Sminthopsis crassicaudata]|uniref:uncharacterized protein LOC141562014 n=1 Tax=Sminthopsis crassicaudata TaxID=9301 RepID=UPI003D69FC56